MKTILVDAIGTFIILDHGVYEPLRMLLEKYPNQKIVLTMAPREKFEELGLVNLPYELYTTEFSPEKSDPKYYVGMLKHFGLSAEDVVYFEHSLEAVESARSVGIVTHHYDTAKRDLSALKLFLDEKVT